MKQTRTLGQLVAAAAVHGLVAGAIYALVECWFVVILPWLSRPAYLYVPHHWGFTLFTFVVYPALGAAAMALFGLLARAIGSAALLPETEVRERCHAAATATVVLAFAANLVERRPFGFSVMLPLLAICLALLAACALTAWPGVWRSRLRFLANTWTASLLLLGLPFVDEQLLGVHSRAVKAPYLAAYFAVAVAGCFCLQKLYAIRIDPAAAMLAGRSAVAFTRLAPLVLLSLGLSLVPRQAPLVAAPGPRESTPRRGRPNVILITLDTVRADHLSAYGYPRDTTPNLVKLAAQATLYRRAIASSDMTLATHASLFTGKYPSWHGAHHTPSAGNGAPLSEKATTLAEMLAAEGYLTLGLVANHGFLSDAFGFAQGFHYYDQRLPVTLLGSGTPPQHLLRSGLRRQLARFVSPQQSDVSSRRAQEMNNEVFAVLHKARQTDAPFFLFVNYMEAHWPYVPPPPFDTLFPGRDPHFTTARQGRLWHEIMTGKGKMSEPLRQHLVSQYDGAIASLDFHLGKLFAWLKEQGLFEDSLIIITSDHGEAFGDRELMFHGVSVYQDQVHIPLIIKYPRSHERQVIEAPVSVVDVLPTVMEVVGRPVPPEVQGVSLLSPASRSASRILISETFPDRIVLGCHPRFRRVERAVTSGSLKLITSTAGKRELYDLARDPNETQSVYKQHQEFARTLQAHLDARLKSLAAVSDAPFQLDRQTIERLRTLGYVQ